MSGDLSGFSMFDLFKAETEMHAAALSQGLVQLEEMPDDLSRIEQLMRAAHSIKGAARIVQLNAVVELAHAMEDCFVAIQKGHETITPDRIDQLLRGVDCFQSLLSVTETQAAAWESEQAETLHELTNSLRCEVVGKPTPPPKAENTTDSPPPPEVPPLPAAPPNASDQDTSQDTAPPVPPVAKESASGQTPDADRTIPVDSKNLNRIMQLASESMIDARRMESLHATLQSIRDEQRQSSVLLDSLLSNTPEGDMRHQVTDFAANFRAVERRIQQHAVDLEQMLWKSERTATALYHQVLGSRMRPFAECTLAFPRMIRDLARSLDKQVQFQISGQQVPVDRDILRKLEAPLNHILRNCVDHGIETVDERRQAKKPEKGAIHLEARHHAGMLTVTVTDDGRGIDQAAVQRKILERGLADAAMIEQMNRQEVLEFLFLPGFSTATQVTEVSGRGVGLDVVRVMVQDVSGTIQVDSTTGQGTRFTLRLPVTLSVIRAALVEIDGEPFAFPLAKLTRIVRVPRDEIQSVQGRLQFELDQRSVGLVSAHELLGLNRVPPIDDQASVVVISAHDQWCGLLVDRFLDEQDLVVRPLDTRLGKVPHVLATSITQQGDPLFIVDIDDLFHSTQQMLGDGRIRGVKSLSDRAETRRTSVLVVDDSITVRELQRQLLTGQSYDVTVAVDGQDGWNRLGERPYDLLITDVDMPRMNGIELIKTARRDRRFEHLPIIIVSYKDRPEDRLAGMEAGANAYLTKGSFHDDSFLRAVKELVGDLE